MKSLLTKAWSPEEASSATTVTRAKVYLLHSRSYSCYKCYNNCSNSVIAADQVYSYISLVESQSLPLQLDASSASRVDNDYRDRNAD